GPAHGVVPDKGGQVGRDTHRVQTVEVLAEGGPGRRVVLGTRRPAGAHTRTIRRVAAPAVADDLGGDALADGALRGRVGQDRPIAVAVAVDEPRTDDLARGVDHP